jgi:hypothetical protein
MSRSRHAGTGYTRPSGSGWPPLLRRRATTVMARSTWPERRLMSPERMACAASSPSRYLTWPANLQRVYTKLGIHSRDELAETFVG